MSNKLDINVYRHSMSHILASAILKLYPETKLGIGPAIDEGFYYDFEFNKEIKINEDDFAKIEQKMKQIIGQNIEFVVSKEKVDKALELIKDQPYKKELVNDLSSKGESEMTFYQSGDFFDLCAGPHVDNSKELAKIAFKIDRVAGAYWKGNEKNKMLTRIYVLCFEDVKELEQYLKQREEAKARDHKILGEQLDLFSFSPMAPGACFWHPRGLILWQELEKLWREIHIQNGYTEIQTPQLAKKDLWVTSGHWDHYKDGMYAFDVEDESLCLKPMDCPFGILIYKTKPHSYRDFPIRFNEIGRIFRNEKSGVLNGLFRVRQITQDDAHIYCLENQIFDEISSILRMQKEFYQIFNLEAKYVLSTRPDDFMGEIAVWDKAEDDLKQSLEKNKITYEINGKDGAFYGPKIDVHVKDALGRVWQLATIQLDFQLPSRFNMEYTDSDGKKKNPVMIHRAIFGSFERFIGILTETYAGNYPAWLSPEQVRILSISEKHNEFVVELSDQLKKNQIRANVDIENDILGAKVKKAADLKIPYIVVVGDKEKESGLLNIRIRGEKKTVNLSVEGFVKQLSEINNKKSDLLALNEISE